MRNVPDQNTLRTDANTWIFVQDFVGKFWFLALCVQAAYRSTSDQKNNVALGPTAAALDSILKATTRLGLVKGSNTLSNLLKRDRPLAQAARDHLPELTDMDDKAVEAGADAFLDLVLGPQEGAGDLLVKSFVGLRWSDVGITEKPSDWFEALEAEIAYETVRKLLDLDSRSALSPKGAFRSAQPHWEIVKRKNAPFFRLFGGSTLRTSDGVVPALERVPLSSAQNFNPDLLYSKLPWSGKDDDPLLTQVPTNAVLRTAQSFGFGGGAGERATIEDFDRTLHDSGIDLRVAAWNAFAGRRHDHETNGVVWYGESLKDFAEAYFKFLRAAATSADTLPVAYYRGDSPSNAQPLVTAPDTKTRKSTAMRKDAPPPLEDSRKIIEDQIGQSTRGTIAYTEFAQNLLQFQFAARYLDNLDDEFVFPVCELRLDAANALGNVAWDGATVVDGDVASRTGGTVKTRVVNQTSTLVDYSFRRQESDTVDRWGAAFHEHEMFGLMRIAEAKRSVKINLRLRARMGEGCLKRTDGKDSGDALDALQQALRHFVAIAQTEARDTRYVTLKEWEVTFNVDVPETHIPEEDR